MRANIGTIQEGKHTDSFTCPKCRKINILEFSLRLYQQDKRYKDKEWLNQKYNVDKLTQQQIADICGVSPMTIGDWLKNHQIEARPRGITKS